MPTKKFAPGTKVYIVIKQDSRGKSCPTCGIRPWKAKHVVRTRYVAARNERYTKTGVFTTYTLRNSKGWEIERLCDIDHMSKSQAAAKAEAARLNKEEKP